LATGETISIHSQIREQGRVGLREVRACILQCFFTKLGNRYKIGSGYLSATVQVTATSNHSAG
jgi:hypothetical protein